MEEAKKLHTLENVDTIHGFKVNHDAIIRWIGALMLACCTSGDGAVPCLTMQGESPQSLAFV